MKQLIRLATLLLALFVLPGQIHPQTEVQTAPAPVTIPVNLPWLGRTNLVGNVDLLQKTWKVAAVVPKKLDAGQLTIDQWTAEVSNTKGLTIKARTSVFGRAAVVGLKELHGKTKAVFGITFTQPPTLAITPYQSVELAELTLTVETGKPPMLTSFATVFNQKVQLAFGIQKNEQLIKVTIPSLALSDVLPQISAPGAKRIKLSNVAFEVRNFITKTADKPLGVTLAGRIDFSGLDLAQMPIDLSNLAMNATLDKEKGLNLTTTLGALNLPGVGSVRNASFTVIAKPKGVGETSERFDIVLAGSSAIDIPGAGNLDITLSSKYQQGKLKLEAKIDKEFTFHDATLRNARVDIGADSFTIAGDAEILKLAVLASLTIGKDKKVKFVGTVKEQKPYTPFKGTGLPKLEKVALHNLKILLETTQQGQAFVIGGSCTILDTEINATVALRRSADGKTGAVLKGALPQGWKVPAPLNFVTFKSPEVVVSSMAYTDDDLGLKVRPGIGFSGEMLLEGPLKNAAKLTGEASASVKAYGVIGTSMKDTLIQAALGGNLDFKNLPIKSGALILEVTGEPTVGIICNLTIRPTPTDQDLTFAARVNIEAYQVAISGSMEGMWENPVGINGLKIGDLGIGMGFSYASGIPSEVGLTGKLQVGSKKAAMAINITPDPRNIAIWGKAPDLSIYDATALARSMGAKVSDKAVPPFGFKNVELKFAPFGAQIGEIRIERGVTLSGAVEIFSKTGSVDMVVDSHGLVAKGYMNKIDFGKVLTITGTGPDKQLNTADDGPILDFELTLKNQHMYYSGIFETLATKREGKLNIEKDRFYFDSAYKLLGFHSKVHAEAVGNLHNPDFIYQVELTNTFGDFIGKIVANKLTEWVNDADSNLEARKQDLSRYDADIAAKKQQIADLQKVVTQKTEEAKAQVAGAREQIVELENEAKGFDSLIAEAKKQVKGRRETVSGKLTGATTQVQKLQNRIKILDREIRENDQWYASLSRVKKVAFFQPYEVKLAALKVRKASVTASMTAATQLLNSINQGVTKAPVELSPQVASLFLAKETTLAALNAAQKFLKGLDVVAFDPSSLKEAIEIGKLTAQIGVLKGKQVAAQAALAAAQKAISIAGEYAKMQAQHTFFKVKRASYKISLNDLVHGKLPEIELDLIVFKKEINLKRDFDFRDAAASAKQLAEAIIRKLRGSES